MLLDERVNTNFDKLNDNDLHIAHFVNTHIEPVSYTHLTLPTILRV